MNEKVTIGMTTYNAADTIRAAVESALAQDYPDFEIVIVDDVSKDATWDIVQDMARRHYETVRVFRNEANLGVAGTRNRILAEAVGDFIAFFDDDDVSVPDRLSRQVARITGYERDFAHGAPVMCHAARMQNYPDGRKIIAPTMGCITGKIAPHGTDMAARILYNKKIDGGDGAMPTCSQMARATTYRMLGGFDAAFRRMEDTELNVRLALAGGHFIGIAEPLVIQTMTQADDKHIAAERDYARQLYAKHRDFLIKEGRGDFDKKWLEAKHDYWEGARGAFLIRLAGLFMGHPVLFWERVLHAMPNMGYNAALRRFHRKS